MSFDHIIQDLLKEVPKAATPTGLKGLAPELRTCQCGRAYVTYRREMLCGRCLDSLA